MPKQQKTKAKSTLYSNELEEMTSMLAHEIRNPLGGIRGFATLLERDLKDRPELQKMASYIIQGTDNINEIVTRALDDARPPQTHEGTEGL